MSPLLAAYLMETINGLYVIGYAIFFSLKQQQNHFAISKKDFIMIARLSPLLMLAAF
jgi:hypothetical protein